MSARPFLVSHEVPQRIQRLIVALILAIVLVPIVVTSRLSAALSGLVVAGVAVVVLSAFRRLNVEVTETDVVVSLTYGWPRRRVALAGVRSVSVQRMRGLYGWGIRLVPKGTMWRAWGYDTVRLELANGRLLHIGVDDGAALETEITRRLGNTVRQAPPT